MSRLGELSRIALASAAMSATAVVVLTDRAGWPELMPEPARLIRGGSTYLADEYHLVGRALVIGLVVSCGLAWVARDSPYGEGANLNEVIAYNFRAARELRGSTQEEVGLRLEPLLGRRLLRPRSPASSARTMRAPTGV